jgi:unsaturated rhamnogalacturonyl hydrolase
MIITSLILTSLISLGALVLLGVDVVVMASRRLARYRMGCWDDLAAWRQAVERIALRWLVRTPKVSVMDSHRLLLLDMLSGNYSKASLQHWQEAALLLGAIEVWKSTASPVAEPAIQAYLQRVMSPDGRWRELPTEVDVGMLAYALMQLPDQYLERYRPALGQAVEMITGKVGDDGTVVYRDKLPHYRFVDTVGFVCPFFAEYGARFNRPDLLALAIKQIREYDHYGVWHADIDIPCHAYDVKTHYPLGIYGWGRGIGWYALGVVDTYHAMPAEHPEKVWVGAVLQRVAHTLCKLQRADGGWSVSLKSSSDFDASATAIFAWTLRRTPRQTDEVRSAADQAMTCLRRVTRRSGVIDFSQGDTKAIGVYSRNFSPIPFTQGMVLRVNAFQDTGVNARLADRNNDMVESGRHGQPSTTDRSTCTDQPPVCAPSMGAENLSEVFRS